MAEQTFRSPGFFEQEIDLSARVSAPSGTPAGVIGTALEGPAFVPVTIGSFADFDARFGTLDPDRFGPYAVREFLLQKTSLTYLRVLGAGANESASDFSNTELQGVVKNAGFRITGSRIGGGDNRDQGTVQFLVAAHTVPIDEAVGYPIFTDNQSFDLGGRDGATDTVRLVRGVILNSTGTKVEILSASSIYSAAGVSQDSVVATSVSGTPLSNPRYFKLAVSSSTGGVNFGNDDNSAGVRIFTASLDPSDSNYVGKVLNTNPLKFQSEGHLLYLDLSVENELASTDDQIIAMLSGTMNTSAASGDTTETFIDAYGRYDTRYTTPKTTKFISQPFGEKEYDLFHLETISDGEVANSKFKISIANLRASTDDRDRYGTFEVQVRDFNDTDTAPEILERYPECSLNPNSDRYIARQIGDKKVRFDFDQEDPDERRLVISGKYPNVSRRIRVVTTEEVQKREVPSTALPFGFRGASVAKTSDSLVDIAGGQLKNDNNVALGSVATRRLAGTLRAYAGGKATDLSLTGSIVPPMPLRFKVTRGDVNSNTTPPYVGAPGTNERTDARYYWGVKTNKMPTTSSVPNAVLNPNVGGVVNPLVQAYTQFAGIEKLDTLVTGSGRDSFNSNKFTLARVALSNRSTNNVLTDLWTTVTGTARAHMKEAAYIRDGKVDRSSYTVDDGLINNRFTLASLLSTSSVLFNRFTDFAKFTNIFYGGFDGVNILDRDQFLFKDRAFSPDAGGKAGAVTLMPGGNGNGLAQISSKNQSGENRLNNNVASMRQAVDIMTDPMSVNINILAIPGVREPFVTDRALDRVKDYSQAIYLMDSARYDEDQNRLYDDSSKRPDVRETSEQLETRGIDNNYAATFFPDVYINDPLNNQVVKVPSSVASLGTLAFNDKVAFPWFAPAGFNRGGLDFVTNVEVRLTSDDRDVLYDAKINPIAVFPNAGFVIFGQKTLQMAKSALDRINVRRLMLEVKRQIVRVADKLLFEPNNAQTRARFISQITPLLALIQAQAGIEQFKVVCNETNNSAEDVESNKMNGRIIVVPTRAVEFISIDFIITNSGVSFE